MSWHADDALLERYAAGTLDDAWAFSLEAHLLACEECRARTVPLADLARVETVWADLQELVDAPRRTPVERVLIRLGVRDHIARLLAATPSLTLPWLAAVALCLAFAVVAAHGSNRGVAVFLALAPLLPLAGVAAAYGPWLDPTYEVGLAAPMRTFSLLLLRSSVVLLTTTVLTGVAALALPNVDWRAAAWLLPALGLVLVSVALTTWISAELAFGGVASCWIGGVLVARAASGDAYVAFEAPAQAAFATTAAVAAIVLAWRLQTFETEREA